MDKIAKNLKKNMIDRNANSTKNIGRQRTKEEVITGNDTEQG